MRIVCVLFAITFFAGSIYYAAQGGLLAGMCSLAFLGNFVAALEATQKGSE